MTAPLVSDVLRIDMLGCSGITFRVKYFGGSTLLEFLPEEAPMESRFSSLSLKEAYFVRSASFISAAALRIRFCSSSSVKIGTRDSCNFVPGNCRKQPRIVSVPGEDAFPVNVTNSDEFGCSSK